MEQDSKRKLEEDDEGVERSRAGFEHDQEGNTQDGRGLKEGEDSCSGGREAAEEHTGGRETDRRYSTLAR